MQHTVLDNHKIIGWDIDGTLLDGPNADFFRSYIKAHPEKTHILITFRGEDWAEIVFDQLAFEGMSDSRKIFESLHACPTDLGTGGTLVSTFEYLEWKGKVASETGCTVLVDDMVSMVSPGCSRYGIELLDATKPV